MPPFQRSTAVYPAVAHTSVHGGHWQILGSVLSFTPLTSICQESILCQALSSTVNQQDVRKTQTLPAQIPEHCETDTNHLLQCHQRRENYTLRKYPGGGKKIQFFERTNELNQPGGLKSLP